MGYDERKERAMVTTASPVTGVVSKPHGGVTPLPWLVLLNINQIAWIANKELLFQHCSLLSHGSLLFSFPFRGQSWDQGAFPPVFLLWV